jgi:hypothetical protein
MEVGRVGVCEAVRRSSRAQAPTKLRISRVQSMTQKFQIQKTVSIYTFNQTQIQNGDVKDFLVKYDPFRLSQADLRRLFGNLAVDFEGIEEDQIVPTHPALRILGQRLHAIWPWSPFFLHLECSLGPSGPVGDFPLFALGLCISDFKMVDLAIEAFQ